MPRRKPPELTFQKHIEDFLVRVHGYVAVEGLPVPPPTLGNVTGVVVHTALPQTGTFETSDPMLNQLQRNIQWGQSGNCLDVPTDCPQRDKRVGWTGERRSLREPRAST